MSARSAVTRQALRDSRTKTFWFAVFGGLYALGQVAAYSHSYADPQVRASFAQLLGSNTAIRMFYGTPYDLMSTGGYAAWRVAGISVILYAIWAVLGVVAGLRGEEESGRADVILAGLLNRGQRFGAVLTALAIGTVVLWAALVAGLVIGGLSLGGSVFMGLAVVSPVPVFLGIGAWASLVAPSRRVATEMAVGAVVLAFLLRVVGDTAPGAEWVRWLTPLGWAELARPFTDPRPLVLVLPAVSSVALLWSASRLAAQRDVGTGLIAASDRAAAKLRMLRSPTTLGIREARGSLTAWLLGAVFYSLVIGAVSQSVTKMKLPAGAQEQIAKFGGASITTATGYLSFVFLIFVFALSLFGAAQVSAARREEADGHLEVLFAQPSSRWSWLAGRVGIAAVSIAVIAFAMGVGCWLGAASQRAAVSLSDMLGAAANTLPAALLFLGLGTLAYALSPRAGAGIAYGLVAVSFVWELFGALLGAPAWTLGLSPFHHVGLVPAQDFKASAAAVMVLLAVASAGAGLAMFRRRDLTGG